MLEIQTVYNITGSMAWVLSLVPLILEGVDLVVLANWSGTTYIFTALLLPFCFLPLGFTWFGSCCMERVAFNKTYIVVYCYAIVSSWAVELFCLIIGVWLDWCTEYGVWQYVGFVSYLIAAGLTAWLEIEGLKLL